MGPKQLQGGCVLLLVGVWNGWQELYQHKQCGTGAIKSSLLGDCVVCYMLGDPVPFWRHPHAILHEWTEKRAPTPMISICSSSDHPPIIILILLRHLLRRLLVCWAPQMLSQVMVRRRTRITNNTEQRTVGDTRTKGANEVIGDAVHVRIMMTCWGSIICSGYCKLYR